MLGIHPGPFTFRELEAMYEGRSKFDWDQTSALMAMLAEVNRNAKKRSQPFKPSDFHPHYKHRRRSGKSLDEAIAILEAQQAKNPCPPRR